MRDDVARIHGLWKPSGVKGVRNLRVVECELEAVFSGMTDSMLLLLHTFRCKVCGAIYTEHSK